MTSLLGIARWMSLSAAMLLLSAGPAGASFSPGLCFCWASTPRDAMIGRIDHFDEDGRAFLRVSEPISSTSGRAIGDVVDLGYVSIPSDGDLFVYDESQSPPSWCVLPIFADASYVTTNCTAFSIRGHHLPDECSQEVALDQVISFYRAMTDSHTPCFEAAQQEMGVGKADDGGCQSANVGAWESLLVLLTALGRRRHA